MTSFLRQARQQTFTAFTVRNYRRYFAGQSISLIGTSMQMTAQAWLVLVLTHSSADLGYVVALQALPVLLIGSYGGVVADRVNKRRMMIALQSVMGLQALTLGLLAVLGTVQFWEICLLAAVLGVNNAFENPSRQAFVQEMVGRAHVRNAVTLNSVMFNAARVVGPAVGGVLIATIGVGTCFLVNAASFVAVVASLLLLDGQALWRSTPLARGPGQLREGLRYAARTPAIALPLVMMAVIGTLAYEFQVTLPVLARSTFHGGAEAYGFMTAAMSIGAVAGGLVTAARGRTGLRPMLGWGAAMGLTMTATALSPDRAVAYASLVLVGATSISFIATGNTTVQLAADPSKRGRMLSLWQIARQGTTPVGSPVIGWVIDLSDARVGLLVGAATCLAAGGGALLLARRFGVPLSVGSTGEGHRADTPTADVAAPGAVASGLASAPDGGPVV